nr:hypothetical protein [Ruegeria sp. HKCCD6119]
MDWYHELDPSLAVNLKYGLVHGMERSGSCAGVYLGRDILYSEVGQADAFTPTYDFWV